MRLVVCSMVLLATLAGCTDEPEGDDDPLLGLCPQWVQGPGEEAIAGRLNATTPQANLVVAPLVGEDLRREHLGRELDLYRIRLTDIEVDGGRLQLRAFAETSGQQKSLRDYRLDGPQLVPVVSLGDRDVDKEFDVVLTAVHHEEPAAPDSLLLAWTFEPAEGGEGVARFAAEVTYHYRVCGADF